ncbi:MAG: 5,10-methylenetetrahydrofolate reductase [Coriobacteriaceae bacterium]|nr:5,10-methylenetetrahydrofolate reductase [Coriobacteriaceae bacterium]
MSLAAAFDSGRFVVTSEVGPPKGTDVAAMLETAEVLAPHVDALNVTDNQAAVMRLSTLAACVHLTQAGHETVYQVTCRDRNRLALQSDLLGAASFGITNVLALTGDHVRVGDHREAKAVFDLESVQLLRVIQTLNAGTDMAGKELHGTPEFYAGAVVTPDSAPLAPQLAKFEKKVAAGARYFQTQAVYDLASFESFMRFARRFEVKVLAGIVVLRSARMASFMNANIPGITVPEGIVAELTASEDAASTGVQIAARFIRGAREMCDGIHIMAIGAEHLAPRVIGEAGLTREVPA